MAVFAERLCGGGGSVYGGRGGGAGRGEWTGDEGSCGDDEEVEGGACGEERGALV